MRTSANRAVIIFNCFVSSVKKSRFIKSNYNKSVVYLWQQGAALVKIPYKKSFD